MKFIFSIFAAALFANVANANDRNGQQEELTRRHRRLISHRTLLDHTRELEKGGSESGVVVLSTLEWEKGSSMPEIPQVQAVQKVSTKNNSLRKLKGSGSGSGKGGFTTQGLFIETDDDDVIVGVMQGYFVEAYGRYDEVNCNGFPTLTANPINAADDDESIQYFFGNQDTSVCFGEFKGVVKGGSFDDDGCEVTYVSFTADSSDEMEVACMNPAAKPEVEVVACCDSAGDDCMGDTTITDNFPLFDIDLPTGGGTLVAEVKCCPFFSLSDMDV